MGEIGIFLMGVIPFQLRSIVVMPEPIRTATPFSL